MKRSPGSRSGLKYYPLGLLEIPIELCIIVFQGGGDGRGYRIMCNIPGGSESTRDLGHAHGTLYYGVRYVCVRFGSDALEKGETGPSLPVTASEGSDVCGRGWQRAGRVLSHSRCGLSLPHLYLPYAKRDAGVIER